MTKGRDEEAKRALIRYCKGRTSGFDADVEFEVMREAIQNEPEKGQCECTRFRSLESRLTLLSGREMIQGTNKRRTIIVAVQFFFLVRLGLLSSSVAGG